MKIEIARVLVDFGAVVLIWMVQLIIYPSFLYFSDKDLMKWHVPYTKRVTFIVAPIMFIQSGIIAYQIFNKFNWLHLLSSIICGLLWLLTFFEAVPLHQKIDLGKEVKLAALMLVQINKKRTALWTVLFIISICQIIF
ncbi:MAG: hypothetical protein ACJASF_000550 [Vicingaceae bacterium]|jgi:hypothetical protein